MLLRVFDRLSLCETLDSIVVATTHAKENRVIQKICEREGIGCVVVNRPDEDVVARLQEAARATSADAIMRVTPDCPLIDPTLVDKIVAYGTGQWDYGRIGWPVDYCSNVCPRRSYPDGLDAEYISLETLDKLPSHIEDATRPIWESPMGYRIRSVVHSEDLSRLNWTVNVAKDLEFVRWVYERLPEGFSWLDVLALGTWNCPWGARFP